MAYKYINAYALESLYKVTKKKNALKQLVETYFIHLEKTIKELNEEKSDDALAGLCHRIKGSSRNTGAVGLAESFQVLELQIKGNQKPSSISSDLKDLEPLISATKLEFQDLLSKLT